MPARPSQPCRPAAEVVTGRRFAGHAHNDHTRLDTEAKPTNPAMQVCMQQRRGCIRSRTQKAHESWFMGFLHSDTFLLAGGP